MRRHRLAALLIVGIAAAACTPSPTASEPGGGACAPDLPERTSPTDYPVAVLHVRGDDLPPVIGEVEWLGGDEPVATAAPLAVSLERFTVLQIPGAAEFSLRMTDGVSVAEWRVDALPAPGFRAGDLETATELSSGSEAAELICVPVEDGEWAIRATLTFADGNGSGTFYWRLNVGASPGA
jgi:hypothetical protein